MSNVAPEYKWVTAWFADARSKVDVAGLKGKIPCVLVEVELKKDNPVENVVKIWRWADHKRVAKRVLFLHAFSAHYRLAVSISAAQPTKVKQPSKIKQFERAVFVGHRMKQDHALKIDYKDLLIQTTTRAGKLIPYKPRMRRGAVTKEGGAAMHRAAETLANTIAKLLRSRSHR